jgi:hypothetical protein
MQVKAGKLWFRGRLDDVVKVRGVRVALEEVQERARAALGAEGSQVAAVAAAAAWSAGVDGGEPAGLVLYVTEGVARRWVGREAGLWAELRGALKGALLPCRVVVGAQGQGLPATATGKLDRRALSAGWGARSLWPEGQGVEGEREERIESLFGRLVGGGGRAVRGLSLLERGGDSLVAMRALEELRRLWGVRLGVEDMGLGVAALARRIEAQEVEGQRDEQQGPSKRQRGEEGAVLELEVAWRVCLDKCVDGRAVYVGAVGLIVVGSHAGAVVGLDPVAGRERWRTRVGGRVEGTAAVGSDGRSVLIGCFDGRWGGVGWGVAWRARVPSPPQLG